MEVLVAVASRHGSTWEIGEAVAEVLRGPGWGVELRDPEDVEDVRPYGAVVLGSSVYVGRWSAGARAMADRHAAALVTRPLWLFSSGPVGRPPRPADELEEVEALGRRLGARAHVVFPGHLDRSRLTMAERAVVGLVRAGYGDVRDWDLVENWATGIVAELLAEPTGVSAAR